LQEHPYPPFCDFDVGENVCGGKLILLALRRLAGIRGEGGDVDQPGNAVICSSLRPERGDHLAEGRAVGPDPVDEHDARLGLHGALESQTARQTGTSAMTAG